MFEIFQQLFFFNQIKAGSFKEKCPGLWNKSRCRGGNHQWRNITGKDDTARRIANTKKKLWTLRRSCPKEGMAAENSSEIIYSGREESKLGSVTEVPLQLLCHLRSAENAFWWFLSDSHPLDDVAWCEYLQNSTFSVTRTESCWNRKSASFVLSGKVKTETVCSLLFSQGFSETTAHTCRLRYLADEKVRERKTAVNNNQTIGNCACTHLWVREFTKSNFLDLDSFPQLVTLSLWNSIPHKMASSFHIWNDFDLSEEWKAKTKDYISSCLVQILSKREVAFSGQPFQNTGADVNAIQPVFLSSTWYLGVQKFDDPGVLLEEGCQLKTPGRFDTSVDLKASNSARLDAIYLDQHSKTCQFLFAQLSCSAVLMPICAQESQLYVYSFCILLNKLQAYCEIRVILWNSYPLIARTRLLRFWFFPVAFVWSASQAMKSRQ